MPELDETIIRRARVLDAQQKKQEGAEQIYRCVAPLRDLLPPESQRCVAAILEWAREGIRYQNQVNSTPELDALHAAVSYARDVLVETARRREPVELR
jgi:hypothetical protein